MKRIFLIDTENVGRTFLDGIDKIKHTDKLILFHYEKAASYPKDILYEIIKSGCSYEMQDMQTHTKNAMDFQICSYLGILAAQYKSKAEYYIVSKDKGYDAALELLNRMNPDCQFKRVYTLNVDNFKDNMPLELNALLASYSKKARKKTVEAFIKSKDLLELHNCLQVSLVKDGKEIYQMVKPLFMQVHNLAV